MNVKMFFKWTVFAKSIVKMNNILYIQVNSKNFYVITLNKLVICYWMENMVFEKKYEKLHK